MRFYIGIWFTFFDPKFYYHRFSFPTCIIYSSFNCFMKYDLLSHSSIFSVFALQLWNKIYNKIHVNSFSSKILEKSEFMGQKGWNQVQGPGQDLKLRGKIFLSRSGCVSDDPRGLSMVPSIRASERNKSKVTSKKCMISFYFVLFYSILFYFFMLCRMMWQIASNKYMIREIISVHLISHQIIVSLIFTSRFFDLLYLYILNRSLRPCLLQ